MLKEHLKKHFKRIQTIKLKRHHYILWWFWIAAIIAIASIFGFQNIGTHAAETQCTIQISRTEILVDESWTATITCKWMEKKPDILTKDDIEYASGVIEISDTATCDWDNTSFDCTFYYTWKEAWTSEFNVKAWSEIWNDSIILGEDKIKVRNWKKK